MGEVETAKVNKLPPKDIDYNELMEYLTRAHFAIGELKGVLSTLKNPDLLISPLQKKEAVASSAIERTQASLEEVLKFQAEDANQSSESAEKVADIKEIINYDMAMSLAIKELKNKPIGENLLKQVHHILLDSVRGQNKNRGNFRRVQVYIGKLGTDIGDAKYVPPLHTEIPDLMSNWEKYLNSELEKNPLIRIGVAHYQFEAIHPFADGNGRIGRLLIPLFLYSQGILSYPTLYISGYLDDHCDEYHRLLNKVDKEGDWVSWLRFFLTAVEKQAVSTMLIAKDRRHVHHAQCAVVAFADRHRRCPFSPCQRRLGYRR